ncbi:MAG: Ubiquitin- modifier 1 [Bathelium mastoideum]|nr:MAG: Ubiquitin- modifier 1 [Bathelium mastoideum]KAI9687950.1 MAG: Ubiquitin- modifier 1 [Bathelium mastoideum]
MTAASTATAAPAVSAERPSIPLCVEFTGGLELLFSKTRQHRILLPSVDPSGQQPTTIAYLIHWLCNNLMTDDRREMFILDDCVRPGILVLINDADWELEGEEGYELREGDSIVFVSTLHGG